MRVFNVVEFVKENNLSEFVAPIQAELIDKLIAEIRGADNLSLYSRKVKLLGSLVERMHEANEIVLSTSDFDQVACYKYQNLLDDIFFEAKLYGF